MALGVLFHPVPVYIFPQEIENFLSGRGRRYFFPSSNIDNKGSL